LLRIFGPKRDEMKGGWRKMLNEELRNLIMKLRRMRRAGQVARMGESRNAYRLLIGKTEGNRLLGGTGSSWVDNIKMDRGEI
jgi:hypothetical protein